jgi:hypothetical protein
MKCPDCAEDLPENTKICPHCHANLLAPGVTILDEAQKEKVRGRIRSLNNLSLLFGVPGLILQVASNAVQGPARAAVALGGLLLLVVGLALSAKTKGRNPAWGLMGLLSCLGLGFLALMSRVCHNCGWVGSSSSTKCDRCDAPMAP